jgi:hypothetical protein
MGKASEFPLGEDISENPSEKIQLGTWKELEDPDSETEQDSARATHVFVEPPKGIFWRQADILISLGEW